MKNKTAHRNVLSIITGEKNLKLKEVYVEEVILNKSGQRAIRLDARATDISGRNFATEMQNDTEQDPKTKGIVTFYSQDNNIFGKGLAKYTFTEQCEEIRDLHLEDGTKKIFLNMTSRKGEAVLVSLLQYMKHTTLENSEILVKDERIAQLDEIVTEIKQSEEWEAVRMSILSIGLERGMKKGVAWGIAKSILDILEETGPVSEKTREMILTETDAERLSAWVKKAARSNSEEDFLSKI